ncbi:hypothetical protein JCM14036_21760 [Desulfotomaculum defluvii]
MKLTKLTNQELLDLHAKVKRNVEVLKSVLIIIDLEPVNRVQKLLVDINEEINKRHIKTNRANLGQALFQN